MILKMDGFTTLQVFISLQFIMEHNRTSKKMESLRDLGLSKYNPQGGELCEQLTVM